MSPNNVQDYLNKGMYGSNQTNPDERRKYLGSLRERIYLTMTIEQVLSNNYIDALKKEIQLHPDNTLLLNASIDMEYLSPYIQLSNSLKCPFRMISDDNSEKSPIGLVYVAPAAVNVDVVDVSEKYPEPEPDQEKKAPKKKSFFKRFFS